jgi:hypothetical protein
LLTPDIHVVVWGTRLRKYVLEETAVRHVGIEELLKDNN